MRISKALLVLFLALFSFAPRAHAQAAAIFITANGAPTGACQTGVQTPAFFNNSANWGTGSSQIGPGTVVHLCGTFNFPAGGNGLVAQGSGVVGNPVTILFEPGAVLQSPYFGETGANLGGINLGGRSYITINGDIAGGHQGIIQNTGNGSALANKHNSVAINVSNTSNITIQNLSILNMYVHSGTECSGDWDVELVDSAGAPANNVLISNVFAHDVRWGFRVWGTGLEIKNSEVYNMDHAVTFGPNGSMSGSPLIHNNHFHDTANWDTPNDCYHHDGIHAFGDNATVTGIQIYNNLFDGNMGKNVTAWIFIEGGAASTGHPIQNTLVFNNYLKDTSGVGHYIIWIEGNGKSTNTGVYNNTSDVGTTAGGGAIFSRANTGYSQKNNILLRGNGPVGFSGVTQASGGVNSNVYEDINADYGDNNTFSKDGTFVSSIGSWRTLCGCDSNSKLVSQTSINVNSSTGAIGAGSAAISAGENLSYLNIPALNLDINGNPRPTGSTPWDAGPFNSNSGTTQGSVTLSPTSLLFGNQNINTTSAQQLITITNGTPSNVTLGTPAVSLTGTEFAKNNSSTDAFVLVSGDSCAVGVTFTPTATGARASTLTVNYGASSTVTAPLTGTGINPTAISLINYTNCTSQSFSGSCAIPATQSGDSLIVGFSTNNGYLAQTVTSVTDNAPGGTDTCSQVSGARSTNINSPDFTDIWFCPNVKAGASLLNINTSATVAGESQIWEVSNINAVDVVCALNVQPSNASPTSCPITTTQAADFIASVADYQGSISGGFSGNAFTNDSIMQGNGISHLITSAVGTYTAKWSSGSAGAYNNSTAAFYKSTGNMAPVVAFNPLVANFPNGVLGVTSSPVDVTLTNTGNATLTISGKTITGANVGDFAAAPTDTCGSSLAAGSSCVFHFEFTPSVLGTRTATFSFNDNAFGSPHSITLTGTNSSAPVIPIVAPPQNVVAVPN